MADAMRMRRIRNEVRLYLTGNRRHIWPWQQVRWYYRIYRSRHDAGRIFAYLAWAEGKAVGYGIVQESEGKWWPTYALIRSARGSGLGMILMKRMVRFAIELGYGEAWGMLREDNPRIVKLDRELGWEFLSSDGTNILARIVMRPEVETW